MTNYKLNDEKMFADIAEDTAIIINAETGVYYGMNKLGTAVYENLINGVSAEKILEKLKGWNNDVEESFKEYIKFVTENAIMIEAQAPNEEIECDIDEDIAKEDEYIPKAEEYLDAQELLQADPVHEVKEEEGWTPDKSSLNEDKEDIARREAKMNQDNK